MLEPIGNDGPREMVAPRGMSQDVPRGTELGLQLAPQNDQAAEGNLSGLFVYWVTCRTKDLLDDHLHKVARRRRQGTVGTG